MQNPTHSSAARRFRPAYVSASFGEGIFLSTMFPAAGNKSLGHSRIEFFFLYMMMCFTEILAGDFQKHTHNFFPTCQNPVGVLPEASEGAFQHTHTSDTFFWSVFHFPNFTHFLSASDVGQTGPEQSIGSVAPLRVVLLQPNSSQKAHPGIPFFSHQGHFGLDACPDTFSANHPNFAQTFTNILGTHPGVCGSKEAHFQTTRSSFSVILILRASMHLRTLF